MNSQEDVYRQTLNVLLKKKVYGYFASIVEFANALKEVQPDLGYTEYKSFIRFFIEDMGRYSDMFIPNSFEWFVKSFYKASRPSKVLIPYATGLECDLFDGETNVDYCFLNKDKEEATGLFADINTLEEIPEEGRYDLILSALPIGSLSSKYVSCQITEQSSKLLSDDGFCVFAFAKIGLNTIDKWLSKLEESGLYCVAIIDMPIGSYAPVTMAEGEIVVFSRKKAEKRFVALLSEEEFAEKIVDNFLRKKAFTSGAKLGVYVDGEIRCYSDFVNRSRIQNKNKSLAKAYNGKPLRINEIGTVHAPKKNNEFQESDSAVYVPKLGKSPVVTAITDFHIKAQNYFQVIVDTEKMLPRFLAFFLNTEEGVNLRQLSYRGATIKAFNTKVLGELVIPCPSIELQSEYLKTYDQLEALRVDIETLKDKLQKIPASYKNIRMAIKDINNTGDKFTQWIESLPYPIATILKRYSVAEDPNKKQEILFHFYEAYAIFEATLLSAALNKNLVDCSALKDVKPEYFEKASFGNWVRMDRALSKLFLGIINSSKEAERKVVLECFRTDDENLIKLLCSRNACNILDSASDYRNNWKGHSGITSEALYKEHVDILDSMLRKLQESIKDLYERVRLIRPISLSFSNGIFKNKVEVLTGSNPIFVKETIKALTPLDKEKLYIQMVDTGEMLELPPYFILKNSPADVRNACYFYSRVEKGSTKYVSYHYDGKPEDIETGEVVFDHIKRLLRN